MTLKWFSSYAPVDEEFDNVSLLLHGDGTNGSTTIVDSSSSPKAVTAVGDAQINTTVTDAFGRTGVGVIAFDGTGDYLTASYTTAAFDWWTSNYTLEAWIYAESFANWNYNPGTGIPQGTMIGNATPSSTTNYWSFGVLSDGTVRFNYFNGVNQVVTSTAAAALSSWNHVAFTKDATGIRIWVNGVGNTATQVVGTPQSNAPTGLSIGSVNSVSISGFIDDLRITKGVARYTSNFTPPTAPFPDLSPTTRLTA